MCLGIVSANLVTNDAACKIPDDEWLRMYHYVTQKYDIAKSGSYMTVAGMLIMLGFNDNEVANASGVGNIKNAITNPLACEIVSEPYVRHVADDLSAKFRTGTTILITDLMYRVGTAPLVNDIGMGLYDMGWEIVLFKIHESEGDKPLEKLANAIEKAMLLIKSKASVGEGDVTVHVWLSMQFAMETTATPDPDQPKILWRFSPETSTTWTWQRVVQSLSPFAPIPHSIASKEESRD